MRTGDKPGPVMFRRKIFADLSASTLQMLVSQLSGAVIFYLLSRYADKSLIGSVNWCLALCMIVFAIAGFGIDQLTVKKLAAGEDPSILLRSFFIHVFLSGALVIGGLCALQNASLPVNGRLLFLLGLAQCLLYFSSPLKQVANGFERFGVLMIMSVTANLLRVTGLFMLVWLQWITLANIVALYIISAALELLVSAGLFVFFLRTPGNGRWKAGSYLSLLKDSIPQLGVVVCTAVIARFDWVVLGVLGSAVQVAEYSFAYKFYELSTLPLLIIAPLLLPWMAKMYRKQTQENGYGALVRIAKIEIILALFIFLIVNICWVPLIDAITDGKYGASTRMVTLVLSGCAPLLYINNLLWTISFSQARTRQIFFIFLVTCVTNAVLDLLLIPAWGTMGAAIACAVSVTVQTLLFAQKTDMPKIGHVLSTGFVGYLCAIPALAVSYYLCSGLLPELGVAVVLYFLLLVLTRQVTINFSLFAKSFSSKS